MCFIVNPDEYVSRWLPRQDVLVISDEVWNRVRAFAGERRVDEIRKAIEMKEPGCFLISGESRA